MMVSQAVRSIIIALFIAIISSRCAHSYTPGARICALPSRARKSNLEGRTRTLRRNDFTQRHIFPPTWLQSSPTNNGPDSLSAPPSAAPAEDLRILDEIARVESDIKNMEASLLHERQLHHKAVEEEFTSGKSGYHAVQAQVAEYLKRKEEEDREEIRRLRREFARRLHPLLMDFRAVRERHPGTSAREEEIHSGLGIKFVDAFLATLNKFEFFEFQPEIGSQVDLARHTILPVTATSATDINNNSDVGASSTSPLSHNSTSTSQVVESVVCPGLEDRTDGTVIRHAMITARLT